ncbi:MAG: ribosome-associated translation inhibitor RaiA [Clostridia bacterium]|nr:ribosome-associated translation inhibitor RaiA [Clostridia bacterium]
MKTTIVGRKCTPKESFKLHAEKKLEKIEKFFYDEAEAKITVTVEKSEQIVELTISSGGMFFRAEESAVDMNDALDACIDFIIRKIRKNKTKVSKKIRADVIDDYIVDDDEADEEFDIIRSKSVYLKPEMPEEAILQMEMLGHQFYLFINGENDKTCVVYKRKDGGYGLIEPEVE